MYWEELIERDKFLLLKHRVQFNNVIRIKAENLSYHNTFYYLSDNHQEPYNLTVILQQKQTHITSISTPLACI